MEEPRMADAGRIPVKAGGGDEEKKREKYMGI